MARHLKGEEYAAFRAALERMAIDWAEAAELMRMPAATIAETEVKFAAIAEAWKRVGTDVSDMVEAATGDDSVRPIFEAAAKVALDS